MPLLTEVNSSNDFGRLFAKTVATNPPIPVCTPLYKVILSSFLLRDSLFLCPCPLKLGHLWLTLWLTLTNKMQQDVVWLPNLDLQKFCSFCSHLLAALLKMRKHVERKKDAADSQHQGSDKWGRRLWAMQPTQWATEGCSHRNDHSQTSKRTTSLTLAQTANPQND